MADCGTDGKVRQRQILRDLIGKFHRFGKAATVFGDVLRKAQIDGFLTLVDASGENHVDHAVFADHLGHTNCRAAARENTTLAFGKREVSTGFCHTYMCRTCQFQAATDNGTL